VTTRQIDNPELKKTITKAILDDLTPWFGIPEARADYIEKSPGLTFFASMDEDGYTGFLGLKAHNRYTVEIHVMGVRQRHHRRGIGRHLVEAALAYAQKAGYAFIQVKTLDSSHPDKGYEKTRAFYRSMGFIPLETFPMLWDEQNPCLLSVRAL